MILPQALLFQNMMFLKFLNGQCNRKLILILTLLSKLKSCYFVKKKSSKSYPTLHFNENPIYQVQLQSA